MRRLVVAAWVSVGIVGVCLLAAGSAPAVAGGGAQGSSERPRPRVLFNRYHVPASTIHVARADGSQERRIVPQFALTYSPAFSHDGAWITFTAEERGQADVYRVRLDGSGVERLTDSPAFDDQGVLSPDGRTLAFVSTRDGGRASIFTLTLASGETTNLTPRTSGNFRPVWSPDGQWIAFSSDRDAAPGVLPNHWEHLQSLGLYVMRADGTETRRLTRAGGVAGSPSWSADGRRLVVYEIDEVGAYLAKTGNARTELVEVDVATGDRRPLTATNETKLSPRLLDGGRVAYVARAAGPDGGLRVLHPSLQVETVVSGAIRNASWSSDGAMVVYQRLARLGANQHLEPTFSRDPEFDLVLSEPFPSYSADRTRLVYSQYRPGRTARTGLDVTSPTNTSIEIMAADGSGKRTLFSRDGFSAFSAVWSPSGGELALSVGRYFRQAGLPPAQIGLIKPDGSGFRLLVDDALNNGFPSWSPDGTHLVFKRGRQLATVRVADGTITPLTDGQHYDNFPDWSPRTNTILFTSDRSGRFALHTIRPDGSDLKRLTPGLGSDAHGSWCGDWIVFSSGRLGFKDEMALYDQVPQPYGEIFAMRLDGSDLRQLTDNKWEDASATCTPADTATGAKTGGRAR